MNPRKSWRNYYLDYHLSHKNLNKNWWPFFLTKWGWWKMLDCRTIFVFNEKFQVLWSYNHHLKLQPSFEARTIDWSYNHHLKHLLVVEFCFLGEKLYEKSSFKKSSEDIKAFPYWRFLLQWKMKALRQTIQGKNYRFE